VNGGGLVVAHEAAVALRIGAQDRGELAFHWTPSALVEPGAILLLTGEPIGRTEIGLPDGCV
jgi:hypothetical protein